MGRDAAVPVGIPSHMSRHRPTRSITFSKFSLHRRVLWWRYAVAGALLCCGICQPRMARAPVSATFRRTCPAAPTTQNTRLMPIRAAAEWMLVRRARGAYRYDTA